MQCPNCNESELEPVELEDGLIGAGCPQCSGALLSLIQYRYWIDHHDEEEIRIPDETLVAEETESAKLCPKCRKMMTKYRIGADTINRLDLCGNCDEAWLDKGEWQLLKQLDVYDCLPSLFTEAWQRNIRKQKEKQGMDKHYSNEIGQEAFNRVQHFKSWLDAHPKADLIKQYLNINFDI